MNIYRRDTTQLLDEHHTNVRNVLEYTLLLPKINPIEKSSKHWIKNALLQCYTACHPRLFSGGSYDFFGPSTGTHKNYKNLYDLYFQMRLPNNSSAFLKEDFFANTIMMQCIMSSYDAIMQALITQEVPPYTVVNKLGTKGHNELRASGILTENFTTKNIHIQNNKDASTLATGFEKKIITHKQASINSPFNALLFKNNSYTAQLQSDLIYRLMSMDARQFGTCLHLYEGKFSSEQSCVKDPKYFISLYHILLENLSTNHIDRLYYLYRMEHMFSIGLADCISQNVYHLKSIEKEYPDGVNDFARIAVINKMPNVFSRYLYLQFAFDAMSNTQILEHNFFKKLSMPEAAMTHFEPKSFTFHEWLDVFEQFCRFFSDLVFPVFEWYFLLLLLITAEYNTESKGKTAHDKLILLQTLLAGYIENNHEIIMNPFYGEKAKGTALLSNYNTKHIIRPVYCKDGISTNNVTPYTKKDCDNLPRIPEILTALKPFDTYKNLPLPVFNKTFCYNPVPDDHAYKKFVGQIISFITSP